MSRRPEKWPATSSGRECGPQFPFLPACQKISHRRRIPKSGDPQVAQNAPAASILPHHKTRREQSRSAMNCLLPPRAGGRIPLLRAPPAKRASESAGPPAWPLSILSGATTPDNNAIRVSRPHPLAAHEPLSSAADRASPGHIRFARECPRARPATRLQKHFAAAQRRQSFPYATPLRAFHGRANPGVSRESRTEEFGRRTLALQTDRRQQAAPKHRFRRPRAYGESFPKPGWTSPHRPTNSEREREFSSSHARFSEPHPVRNRAPKILRQDKRNPATIRRKRRETHVPEIPHVFFRAQQRIRAAT